MSMREALDISAYFVIGPENTKGGDVAALIQDVAAAGFTCIQLRSKTASARELIDLSAKAAGALAHIGKADTVALLINDRLDVALAARKRGIKVDGVHVGQSDIPVDICREYLGRDAVVGVSARVHELMEYINSADVGDIDYFGVGPLRETATKPDCGLDVDGRIITRSIEEIRRIAEQSPVPVVVGGGVTLDDIPDLAKTGVGGFFVVSAIAHADDPKAAALQFTESWKQHAG